MYETRQQKFKGKWTGGEHRGPVLAALGAKSLVSVHVHVHDIVHEPAFMAATIIKKDKRNKVLYNIEVFVWF